MSFRPFQSVLRITVNAFVSAVIRKRHRKLDRLSKRVAWMTSFGHDWFKLYPGLEAMLSGGVGARKTLMVIEAHIEEKRLLNVENVRLTVDEIDQFLKDAETVMTVMDTGKPRSARLFQTQNWMRAPF